MEDGGHITGWFIPQGKDTDAIESGLEALCDRVEVDYKNDKPDDDKKNEAIRKALCEGFFYNICRLQKSGEYQ